MSRKRNHIWYISDEEIIQKANESNSLKEFGIYFNINPNGGNYNTIKKRLASCNIEHKLNEWRCSAIEKLKIYNSTSADSKFCFGCIRDRKILKNLLLKEGTPNICDLCKISPIWNNKNLVFHLDHIDGNSFNNLRNNLRLLCPNCHSQTDTYAGKSSKNKLILKGKPAYHNRKLKNRPPKEEVSQYVNENGWAAAGRYYGVSDNAIRKWFKSDIWTN